MPGGRGNALRVSAPAVWHDAFAALELDANAPLPEVTAR